MGNAVSSENKKPVVTESLIGRVVNCEIIEKHADRVIVSFENRSGIIILNHLHDDVSLASIVLNKLKTGSNIRAMIISCDSCSIFLTYKKTLICNRKKIPKTLSTVEVGNNYYGFIKEHIKEGSIVCFFGNVCGIVKGVFPSIGTTVCVKAHYNESILFFMISSCLALEYDSILEYIFCCMDIDNKYKVGGRVRFSSTPSFKNDLFSQYNLADGWSFISFFDESDFVLSFERIISFIDYQTKTLYGISERNCFDPTNIFYRAEVIFIIGSHLLLRYRKLIFICKKPHFNVEIGDYLYISIKCNITESKITSIAKADNYEGKFILAVIEDCPRVKSSELVLCDFEYFYGEWCICSFKHEKVLLHKTEISEDVFKNLQVRGKLCRMKMYNILIIDEKKPLLFNEFNVNSFYKCVLISHCNTKDEYYISLSPFVHGFIGIKGARYSNYENACIECYVTKKTSWNIVCDLTLMETTAIVEKVVPGLGYEMHLSDNSGMRLDIFDHSCHTPLQQGDVVDAYIISKSRISTNLYRTFRTQVVMHMGMLVNGYVYKYDKENVYIHISPFKNARIPCEYFCDTYKSTDPIVIHEGKSISGIIIRDDGDFVVSSRYFDKKCIIFLPRENNIYRALVLEDRDDELNIFIDVLSQYATIEKKPDKRNFLNKYIHVRYSELDNHQKGFLVESYCDRIFFASIEESNEDHEVPHVDMSEESQEACNEVPHVDTSEESQEACNEVPHVDTRIKKRRRSVKYNKKDQDDEINKLKSVYIQRHVSPRTVNPINLSILLQYFRSKQKLENISAVAKKVRLSPDTVKDWFKKSKDDENWSPLIGSFVATRKAMTDILEGAIIWHIYSKFLAKGYQFNDTMCRSVALAFWRKYPQHRKTTKFTASYRWIKRFKKKYGLVNRRVHYHRRNVCTKDFARIYHKNVSELYRKHKEKNTLHLLVNIDETSWQINQHRDITWATVGSEHVEFTGTFPEKNTLTAIAAVSADNNDFKLPLCIIKKGLTNQAKKILSPIARYMQIEVSENGWSTISCFANYLVWLRNELNEKYKNKEGYTKDTEIDILLDQYASHKSQEIKKLATLLHFRLHYIPVGLTDSLQPLDRYIFGVLKSKARKEWYKKYAIDPSKGCDIVEACIILLKCWSEINEETHAKAWNPYSCADECDVDSLTRTKTIEINVEASELTIDDVYFDYQPPGSLYRRDKEINDAKDKAEILEIDDDDERFDLIRECTNCKNLSKEQMDEIIDYEEYLIELHYNASIVRPIEQNYTNNMINVTIQLLGVIPGLPELLKAKESIYNEDYIVRALSKCIDLYLDNSYEGIARMLPSEIVENIDMDIVEIIEHLFRVADLTQKNI